MQNFQKLPKLRRLVTAFPLAEQLTVQIPNSERNAGTTDFSTQLLFYFKEKNKKMFIAGGVASASAFRNRRRNRSMNMDIDRENIPIESSAEKTEANMEILRSMFTKYEEDVLFLLLQSNRYSLENTIENILTMDSDAPSTTQNNIDVPLPSTSTTEAPLGVFTIEDEEELVTKQDDSYFGPEPLPTNEKVVGDDRDTIPEGLQDQIGASEMSLPTNEKKPVEAITDEELAFMLQVCCMPAIRLLLLPDHAITSIIHALYRMMNYFKQNYCLTLEKNS